MHRLWMHGTACIFDVCIRDLDVDSNRGATTDKILDSNYKLKRRSIRRSSGLQVKTSHSVFTHWVEWRVGKRGRRSKNW